MPYTSNDNAYEGDEQECPACGTNWLYPPDSYNGGWYECKECGVRGCDECFATLTLCEECYAKEGEW